MCGRMGPNVIRGVVQAAAYATQQTTRPYQIRVRKERKAATMVIAVPAFTFHDSLRALLSFPILFEMIKNGLINKRIRTQWDTQVKLIRFIIKGNKRIRKDGK